MKTDPIHAGSSGDDEPVRDTPTDATMPSDKPKMLAEGESQNVVRICKNCMVSQRDGGNFCVDCGSELIPIRSVQDSCIGDVVGEKFTIVEKIGSGGMGDVYRGINEPIGQQVAIKFLNEKFTSDEKIVLRFLNEARSYCKVNHPNAVTLLEYGQHRDGSLYLITEFIEGQELTDVVRCEGPLSTKTVTSVGIQVCEVLSAAHGQGIIHRDLKPDNLMLIRGSRGRYAVKVLDFGIAKIADDDRTGPKTETGSVFGTPEFMSPEQARGEEAQPRSDLYALGVILYYMATAKLPFSGKNKLTILNSQLNDEPVPPSEICGDGDIHPRLEAIILRCLEKAPQDRPDGADEVAEQLEAIDWRAESNADGPSSADRRTLKSTSKVDENDPSVAEHGSNDREVIDGPATEHHDVGPLSMSTFDDDSEQPVGIEIDDDDVDPMAATWNEESDESTGESERFGGRFDTDGPEDTDYPEQALPRAGGRRRTAWLGVAATVAVVGGVLVFASGDDGEPPAESDVRGIDEAVVAVEKSRVAATLAAVESHVDAGRFSEADSALDALDAEGVDASNQEQYDAVVERASRARNMEMRLRSHVDSNQCERAAELFDELEELSSGAAADQESVVDSCGKPATDGVADRRPTPSPQPATDPEPPSAPAPDPAPPQPSADDEDEESPAAADASDATSETGRDDTPEATGHDSTADEEAPTAAPGTDADEFTEESEEADSPSEASSTAETPTEDDSEDPQESDDDDDSKDDDDVVLPPSEI